MTVNKKIPLLGFFMLSASVSATEQYLPVLYNFSLLYGFVPVAGAVKDINVTIENEKGNTVYILEAELNREGCIDRIQLNDKLKRSELILKREGRSLKGVKDWSIIVISLDEKCNIVSKTENGGLEEYITSDKGFLTETRFMGNKVAEYIYDERGLVNMTRLYSSRGVTALNTVTYNDPEHKPLDFRFVHTSLYSENHVTESVCQYDVRGMPAECDVTITWDDKSDKKPLRLKVLTDATFY